MVLFIELSLSQQIIYQFIINGSTRVSFSVSLISLPPEKDTMDIWCNGQKMETAVGMFSGGLRGATAPPRASMVDKSALKSGEYERKYLIG